MQGTALRFVFCAVVSTAACKDAGGGSGSSAGPGSSGEGSVSGSSTVEPTTAADTGGPVSATEGTTEGTTTEETTTQDPGTTALTTTVGPGTTTGDGDPNDPFGAPPPQNLWPAGPSDHTTPSGVPFHVDVPEGDTSQAILVIGGWFVNQFKPSDGAITIYVNSDGTMGPMACPKGGLGVPHNVNAMNVHEILVEAGKNVQFDHHKAFVEGSNNNAGWGVEAALDPVNQPLVAGVYVDWAEYNNAPCKAVNTPAAAGSPRVLFISATQCDDTYCPLKSCVSQVQGLGYDVSFDDPLSPNSCDCMGACPGMLPRPHFKGQGSAAPIGPWVMATSKSW